MTQRVNLSRDWDFGDNISYTFTFLKTEFRTLFKALLFIAGPFLLLAGLIIAYMGLSSMYMMGGGNEVAAVTNIFGSGFLTILSFWVGYTMIGVVTLSYMKIYQENRVEEITVDLVWHEAKSHILVALLATVLNAILLIVGFMMLVIPGLVLLTFLTFVIPIAVFEEKGYGGAFSRCFEMVGNKFLLTFGLGVVVVLLMFVLNLALSIPQSIVNLSLPYLNQDQNEPSQVLLILFFVIAFFTQVAGLFLQVFPNISQGLHYFTLLEEKDNSSLLGKIDQMGTEDRNYEETY